MHLYFVFAFNRIMELNGFIMQCVCLPSAGLTFPCFPLMLCREYYQLFVLSVGSIAVYTSFKCFHEYLKSLWLSLPCCALLDRNEVTKLKFEGKTFNIYANQKEVRA